MAPVKSMNGTKMLIQIGDGADPEVFAHDCLINSEREFTIEASTNDFASIDCDSPDAPAWLERVKDTISGGITGAGVLHTSSIETWFDWAKSETPKTCRVKFDVTAVDGGGYIEGKFHLTNFGITGNRGEKAQSSVTLASDGALTWTDAV